jgi:hypothetical protein
MPKYNFNHPTLSSDVTLTYPTSSGTFALEGAGGFSVNNAGANRILFSDGTTSAATASANVSIYTTGVSTGLHVTGSIYNSGSLRFNNTGSGVFAQIINVRKIDEYLFPAKLAIVGNTLTIPLNSGSIFDCDLNAAINTFNIINSPAGGGGFTIRFTIGGAPPYNIVWAPVKWPGGTPPTPSGVIGAVDIYSAVTTDGGTNWYGFEGGLNFL